MTTEDLTIKSNVINAAKELGYTSDQIKDGSELATFVYNSFLSSSREGSFLEEVPYWIMQYFTVEMEEL